MALEKEFRILNHNKKIKSSLTYWIKQKEVWTVGCQAHLKCVARVIGLQVRILSPPQNNVTQSKAERYSLVHYNVRIESQTIILLLTHSVMVSTKHFDCFCLGSSPGESTNNSGGRGVRFISLHLDRRARGFESHSPDNGDYY